MAAEKAHLVKTQVGKGNFGSPEPIQFPIYVMHLKSCDSYSYSEMGGEDKENTWVARDCIAESTQ